MRYLVSVVVFVACCVGCSSKPAAPQAPDTVRAADFAFTPGTLTVPVGTTVTWDIDQPTAPHNVASTSGPTTFYSGNPVGKGTYHYTFTKPGTYTYVCQVHSNMTGKIVVTSPAATTTPAP